MAWAAGIPSPRAAGSTTSLATAGTTPSSPHMRWTPPTRTTISKRLSTSISRGTKVASKAACTRRPFSLRDEVSDVDRGDPDADVALAVADLLVVALAAFVFLDVDFRAFLFANDVGADSRLGDGGHADIRLAFPAHQQDAVEFNRLLILAELA